MPLSTFTTALPTYSDGKAIEGNYTVSANVSIGVTSGILSNVYTYCFDAPSVDIGVSYDCLATSLTAKDNTDYTMSCASGAVPYTIVRNMTITPPQTVAPGVSAPAVINAGNVSSYTTSELWTMTYSTHLVSTLVYTYPCGLIVDAEIGAYDDIEVECSDCLCNFASCIKSLYYKYVQARTSGSIREAENLSNIITELNMLYNMYITAIRCGNDDYNEYCNRIVALLDFAGVNCCNEDTDGYATKLSGVYGTGSVSAGASIYTGAGAPSEGSPEAIGGDIYINTVAPNAMYQYIADTGWVFQMNLQGDSGSDGSSSGTVFEGYYSATSFAEYTYNIPLEGASGLAAIGDRIRFRTMFLLKGNRSGTFEFRDDLGKIVRIIDISEEDDSEYNLIVDGEFWYTGKEHGAIVRFYREGDYDEVICSDSFYTTNYNGFSSIPLQIKITDTTSLISLGYDMTFFNSTI